MKKVLSSAFILLLLLVTLWAAASWYLGEKTEQKLKDFFADEQLRSDSIMDVQILKYERSFLGSKLKIRAQLNPNKPLAQFFQNSFSYDLNQEVEVDIINGPIFFGEKSIKFGSSIWKPVFDRESILEDTSNFLNIFDLEHLENARFVIDFEDNIDYLIPLKTDQAEMLVTGSYKLNTAEHEGKLSIQQIFHSDEKQQISIAPFVLSYVQLSPKDKSKSHYKINTQIPEIEYKHKILDEKIVFQMRVEGDVLISEDVLNSEIEFNFDFPKIQSASRYPIEKGNLLIQVSELSLNKLLRLSSSLENFQSSQQKSQWLLEEQGEYPEGQDQIWLAQDSASQYLKQLPKLIEEVLIKKSNNDTNQSDKKVFDIDTSRAKFTFSSLYKNKKSTVKGALFPVDIAANEDLSQLSLMSLLQLQSEVNLDKELLHVISTRLPIKKSNFKLIYKQNKLLMQ